MIELTAMSNERENALALSLILALGGKQMKAKEAARQHNGLSSLGERNSGTDQLLAVYLEF